MSLHSDLKALIIKNGLTMTEVLEHLNQEREKENEKPILLQNFSRKIIKGTIQYDEVEKVLNIIGYKIKWVKIQEEKQEEEV